MGIFNFFQKKKISENHFRCAKCNEIFDIKYLHSNQMCADCFSKTYMPKLYVKKGVEIGKTVQSNIAVDTKEHFDDNKAKTIEKQTECKGEQKKTQSVETPKIYTREEVITEIKKNQQEAKGKIQNKAEAIEYLRNKILDEINASKSMKFQLASLVWDEAARCFPAPWKWDGAWFKLDLVTKRLFVEVSTYPNQFGACREDKFSISIERFNKIVNEYGLKEELKFIKTDEDLNMIFDENLNEIIFNTQKRIQQEKEEQNLNERIKNAVVLSNELKKTIPSMEMSKVKIELNQPYGNSNICLTQAKGEYCLEYHRYSNLSPNSNTYKKKLSLQESVWVEEQISNTLENKDKTTWQSLPGGDTMTIEIVSSQGKNVNMVRCMPFKKYMDLLHQLEKLAEYGSRFE